MISVRRYAEKIKVSDVTVRSWIKSGKIDAKSEGIKYTPQQNPRKTGNLPVKRDWWTVAEFAELKGLKYHNIDRAIALGEIEYDWDGGYRRIFKSDKNLRWTHKNLWMRNKAPNEKTVGTKKYLKFDYWKNTMGLTAWEAQKYLIDNPDIYITIPYINGREMKYILKTDRTQNYKHIVGDDSDNDEDGLIALNGIPVKNDLLGQLMAGISDDPIKGASELSEHSTGNRPHKHRRAD